MQGRLSDKVVIVAGADCPHGAVLARGCARLGARVIALGRRGPVLVEIARAVPDRIEPLRLDLSDTQTLTRLAQFWGDTPVHAVLNALPLVYGVETSVAGSEALLEAVSPGLFAARGAILTLCRTGQTRATSVAAGAHIQHMGLLAQALAGQGARANLITLAPDLPPTAPLALVAALIGPAGAAVSGAVLPLVRADS